MNVSSEGDTGREAGRFPGFDQRSIERLVSIKGKLRYDNIHFWVIVVLLAACTLIYYAEQIIAVTHLSIQVPFFQTVHDLHRTLFLIPLVYAAVTFRLRGSLVGAAFFLAVILPRALVYSTLPDPLLRPLIFFFLAAALSVLVAVQLNYIEYQIRARGNLRELKEEVTELTTAKENLTRFFNMAAHDMKSPLAAVQSYLNTILGGYTGEINDKQRRWLERSNVRIQDLSELITNLVDMSRITSETILKESKQFSLREEIERCVADARPLAEQKEIRLETDIAEGLPEIFGSAAHIKRALTNLIDNAVKYTPEKGEIMVRAAGRDGSVQVEVIDSGIGIPAAELPRVFEDFYRASNAKEMKGTGLGLSIVKLILELHGGTIRAESPAPGTDRGCKFSFILPVNFAAAGRQWA